MKKILFNLLLVSSLLVFGFSCKQDDEFGELARDNRPAIPITYPNAITYGFNPYIETSLASGGAIKFTISIPASTGRTIKEITKVAAGATNINVQTLNTGPNYLATPLPGGGTTVDFTTTVAEFKTKRPAVSTAAVAPAKYGEIAFIFLVTFDDGSQQVATPVRVRILP